MPLLAHWVCQKNPRTHKNKIGTPPPKKNPKYPPPLKCGILWTWVFLQKERIFPGAHKIGAAISRPRIAGRKFYGHEDFSESGVARRLLPNSSGVPGCKGPLRPCVCSVLPLHPPNKEFHLAKGFCRAKFWAKFALWRGGSAAKSWWPRIA